MAMVALFGIAFLVFMSTDAPRIASVSELRERLRRISPARMRRKGTALLVFALLGIVMASWGYLSAKSGIEDADRRWDALPPTADARRTEPIGKERTVCMWEQIISCALLGVSVVFVVVGLTLRRRAARYEDREVHSEAPS
jgi:hypothetical protein